jgi:hypothetical protein
MTFMTQRTATEELAALASTQVIFFHGPRDEYSVFMVRRRNSSAVQ